MFLACSRFMFLMAFFASALVLGASLYLEYGHGLEPCSLCKVQQYFLQAFGLVSLVAYAHGPQQMGSRIYSTLVMLLALGGAASATKQVLSQRLPPEQLMFCQPDLARLWHNLSLGEMLASVYRGTEASAQVHWTLFDLSIPELSLLAFAGLAVLSSFQVMGSFFARSSTITATGSSTAY